MTICVAAISRGIGAALVTDSLLKRGRPDGNYSALLYASSKIDMLAAAGGAAVVSGSYWPGSCIAPATNIKDAAGDLFEVARAQMPTESRWFDGREIPPETDVLAAGRDQDGAIRLYGFSTRHPAQVLEEGVLIWGASGEWAETLGAHGPPLTMPSGLSLIECRDFALGLARACLTMRYLTDGRNSLDHYLADATIPPYAPPYHVALVTASGVELEKHAG